MAVAPIKARATRFMLLCAYCFCSCLLLFYFIVPYILIHNLFFLHFYRNLYHMFFLLFRMSCYIICCYYRWVYQKSPFIFSHSVYFTSISIPFSSNTFILLVILKENSTLSILFFIISSKSILSSAIWW